MTKRILVTGAAGFIGSHTAHALLSRGDAVVGIDNLNDYYDPKKKRANLKILGDHAAKSFKFYEGDIRDRPLLERLFGDHKIDAIIHLAALAGVRVSVEDPHSYYDVNLVGTLNLVEEARRHGCHVVFASTSSVYGRSSEIPFHEDANADRPLAPYPASKRAAELLGHSYYHLHGVTFAALRFFTVYGPRGRPDMMAYKVLDNIYKGARVPLYNEGQMHRDWTFVTDIATGIIAAADRPEGFEIFNLGRGEPTLLADFVGMLERLSGKPAQLDHEPMPAADVSYTYADISKARSLLGYDPKISIEEGVTAFFRWYKDNVA